MRMKFGRMGRIPRKIRAAWLAFKDPSLVVEGDPLTGALTRQRFFELASRELTRAKRGEIKPFLVFMDLDGLKKINDTEGHQAGDRFLSEFAKVVLANIRSYDLFGRWGGDEFLLLVSVRSTDALAIIIQRVYNLFPRFSWGVSTWENGVTLETMIKRADAALYLMKSGKKKLKPVDRRVK